MAYTPTNWINGDLITSEKLNHIEQGIANAPDIDTTLAVSGKAADAKATGDAIAAVEAAIPAIDSTLAVSGKAADAKAAGDAISTVQASIPAIDTTLAITGKAADSKAAGDAIATVSSNIGILSNLTTTVKTSVVAAINEVNAAIPVIDNTLSIANAAADAKTVGDELADVKSAISELGNGGINETAVGTEININASVGKPSALSVALDWSQGDTTSISPTSPVSIVTNEDCTVTVNGTDYEQDFTTAAGAAGIGKGTWNVLTGKATTQQRVLIVTADMVSSLAKHSGDKYAAVLNFGTPAIYAAGGAILACSHYRVGSWTSNCLRYVNGSVYLYDDTFANDLDTVKSYVAGLNMVVVYAIENAVEYTLTPQQITLVGGANTLSVDAGIMTLAYKVDTKYYVDNAVDGVGIDQYKFLTQTGTNNGTSGAGSSSTIKWGFYLNTDPLVYGCRSVTLTPACSNANTGEYTATRWKNITGDPIANGETLTEVESKTANKGESVTFDYVGVNEFISISFTAGDTIRTRSSDTSVFRSTPLGWINPTTGIFTDYSNNGYLSGTFTITLYKPIVGDCMTLFGKRITLIGDSITEKNGRAAVNHGMWLERWTGCQIQNLGRGGTGFKAGIQADIEYATRISSVDENADIIGVAASFNDMGYTLGTPSDTVSDNTVCGYANDFFDTLIETFPTKRIVCYSEGPWYNYKPGVTASDSFMDAIKAICEAHGVVWNDGLYRGCALRPWIEDNCDVYYVGEGGQYDGVVDNVHPNSAGQKVIARWLERLFEKVVD